MTSSVNPRTFLLVVLVVLIVIGGVCYFFWSRNSGEGAPTALTANLNRPAIQSGYRGVLRQARPDLPPGVPRLIVPGPRR